MSGLRILLTIFVFLGLVNNAFSALSCAQLLVNKAISANQYSLIGSRDEEQILTAVRTVVERNSRGVIYVSSKNEALSWQALLAKELPGVGFELEAVISRYSAQEQIDYLSRLGDPEQKQFIIVETPFFNIDILDFMTRNHTAVLFLQSDLSFLKSESGTLLLKELEVIGREDQALDVLFGGAFSSFASKLPSGTLVVSVEKPKQKKQKNVRVYMSFEEARAYIQAKGFKDTYTYQRWLFSDQRPENFPTDLKTHYGKHSDFESVPVFIGFRKSRAEMMSVEEMIEYAMGLGFTTMMELEAWAKSSQRPDNFPRHVSRFYGRSFKAEGLLYPIKDTVKTTINAQESSEPDFWEPPIPGRLEPTKKGDEALREMIIEALDAENSGL